MRAAAPPAARLAGLAGLAAFGAWQWGLMVSPGAAGRILVALAAAAAAAGLIVLGAHRGLAARAALTAVAALGSVALALLAAGVPAQLLAPANWNELLDGIGQGLEALPGVTVPYTAADPWPRLVILVGGGLLVAFAVLTAFGAVGARGGRARAARALPLAALVLLFVVPSVARELPDPYLRGAAFAALVAAFLWLERVTPDSAARAGMLVAGAIGLGLLAAPLLDRGTPIIDVNDLAGSIAPSRGTTFDWDHRYGPLDWPRDGVEVLRIKAAHSAYWKAENLDGFDGLRWLHVRGVADEEPPAAFYTHPDWTQDVRVTVRSLNSEQFIGAGSTLVIRDARAAPIVAGSPGTYNADTPLRRGDSYGARVYTPRPTARDLASATIPASRHVAGGLVGSPLYAYLTLALPGRGAGGSYTGRPEIAGPGEGNVAFPPFGQGGAPSRILRGVVLGDGAAALRASPYAGTYALARRLAAGAHTPYQYARAVEGYLAKGFSYNETPPQRAVPLASFLTADRTGYCQQFSGAMALLLRMGGIPARVATGFAPGSYSRSRGEYVVRDNDAHSWVEAYFEPYGWVPFDPTPAAAPAASQASFGATASAGTPDPRDTGAGRNPTRKSATAFSRGGDGGPGALPVLAVAAVVIAAFAAVALALPGRRRRRDASPRDAHVVELERALRRTGRPAAYGTTLRALERRLSSLPGADAYLRALGAHRFAAAAPPPTPAERRALRRALGRGLGLRGRARALWALPPRLH
ncbi:MAG TPA: transglutaminase-like domain-containing protein [Solirubrobacteraceae bacterium]|nr:transglutaminase-like domain-containing protein [Solirubrobacteraceae bacterium]